jgi:hypothetical protein
MSRKQSAKRRKAAAAERIASRPKPPRQPPHPLPVHHGATLADLQSFMHRFIVHPGPDPDVYRRNERDIAQWIKPSHNMGPAERLGVYRWQYWQRLENAMGRDYPAVKRFLGPQQFKRLIDEYVASRPPRSFNITRVRDGLPEFVAKAQWTGFAEFLADVAALERSIGEVYDAPEVPVLPPERWPGTPGGSLDMKLIDALQFRAYQYPAHQFLKSPPDSPAKPFTLKNPNWLVVYRKKFEVWRIPLSKKAFELLTLLSQGVNLDTAIRQVTGQDKAVHEELHKWLAQWLREGFFRDFAPPQAD